MRNSELLKEICPGCGALIDLHDVNQLISHYNFNMTTGKYECNPGRYFLNGFENTEPAFIIGNHKPSLIKPVVL
jgi:hypothetical protein